MDRFSSRWGLIFATLGMAVGTGNIWRFPRIAASQGGGSFLIAWVVFLLMWSIPLMIVEFYIGRKARKGPVEAFSSLVGEKFAWMGGWIALCSMMIMAYYAVVAGWCFRYLHLSLTGGIWDTPTDELWQSFAATYSVLPYHLLSLALAVIVVYTGVRGIEKTSKILMPTLVVLVVLLALRAVTLDGAVRGLNYLFKPDFGLLLDPKVWLHALTQNAWDTGAGWGLILAYAVYMSKKDDIPLTASLIAFGNNSISLMAGIMVLSTLFSINPGAKEEILGAGNEGITFIWMPRLLETVPFGGFFTMLFFLALAIAALTSLISMIELGTRVFIDIGYKRKVAVAIIATFSLVMGLPSALSMEFFRNQDWVWGVGLILSGLFFSFGAIQIGVEKMANALSGESVLFSKKVWIVLIKYLIPVQAVILIVWWIAQSIRWYPDIWWSPLIPESVGTILLQWGAGLIFVYSIFGRKR